MGGGRCVFRHCAVNCYKYRNMHFFRFPVREPERLKQWIEMSGAHNITSMRESQKKNRLVCARHFRDECFMNYKKDSLARNSVPTLMRIGDDLALDYNNTDEDGTPNLIHLSEPKMKHLIPPSDFICPLEMDQIDANEALLNSYLQEKASRTKRIVSQKRTYEKANIRPKSIEKRIKLQVEPTSSTLIELIDSEHITLDEAVESNHEQSENDINELSTQEDINLLLATDDEGESGCLLSYKPLETKETSKDNLNEQLQIKEQQNILLKNDNDVLEQANTELEIKYTLLAAEHAQLQAAHDQLQIKYKKLENEQPTKATLFNSIKKYLCASMTTLVRMEMFGSPERAWKPDERQVALELYKFDEKVYRYFSDEWRFRLPALRDVRLWANDATASIENEEDI